MKKLSIPVLVLASSLSTAGAAKDMNDESITTRVFISEHCAMYDGKVIPAESQSLLAVLGSALISSTIDQGLSLFSKILNSRGEDKVVMTKSSVVTNHFRISPPDKSLSQTSSWKPSPDNRCVLIVSGEFNSQAGAVGDDFTNGRLLPYNPAMSEKLVDKDKLKSANAEMIKTHLNEFLQPKLNSNPTFIYEGVISYSSNNEAYLMTSTFLWVDKLKSAKRNSSKRGLGLTVAWDGPRTSTETPSTLSAITMDFGEVKSGVRKVFGDFKKGARSPLMKPIQPDSSATALLSILTKVELELTTANAAKIKSEESIALNTKKLNEESDPVKKKTFQNSIDTETIVLSGIISQITEINTRLNNVKNTITDAMPVEINATIIETRKGSDIAKFFAEVFDGASEEIGGTLKEELVPTRRRTAAETEQTRLQGLEDQLSSTRISLINAKKAEAALTEESNEFDRAIALETLSAALTAHNRVRVQLELPILTEF